MTDILGMAGSSGADEHPVDQICSAKGCTNEAVHALLWRNPRIHQEARRKVWVACDDHREHLSSFLSTRNFLIEVRKLADLDGSEG